jgi:hypothetical protein
MVTIPDGSNESILLHVDTAVWTTAGNKSPYDTAVLLILRICFYFICRSCSMLQKFSVLFDEKGEKN